jgi:glycosyltransferase involved in cell wall biosynthesis
MKLFGAVYCLYEDYEYLELSVNSITNYVDKIVFLINDVPFEGLKIDDTLTKKTIEVAENLKCSNNKIEIIYGHWTKEPEERNFGLTKFYKEKIDYCIIIDSDEIYHPEHFLNIKKIILNNNNVDAFHIEWNTYWTKDYYCIQPREHFTPIIAVKVKNFVFTGIRFGITSVLRTDFAIIQSKSNYNGMLIPYNLATCFHLSYARTDQSVKRKLETSPHNPEFIKDWYNNVWKAWKPNMQNLHPVTPEQYKIAVKTQFTQFPSLLEKFIKKEKLTDRQCSIIILNWNSCELLKKCINLITINTKRKYEIIIVDNGSIDDSVEYIKSMHNCKAIFNKENLGFSGGVNSGLKVKNENNDVCLLNVDAEVQENWLENLYDSLINNEKCGIVGPLGNEVQSGYQSANYVKIDTEVPNLMGFCMLIMKEVYDKIGYFDESFKIGGYEDNDYGMRAILAGYKLYLSAKSLVIHKAHQVFKLNGLDYMNIDPINKEVFINKIYNIMMNYSKVHDFFENTNYAKLNNLIIGGSDAK